MKEQDQREVLDLIELSRNRTADQNWPKELEWFMCPDCKVQTLAMKFIPKSMFPDAHVSLTMSGNTTYGFVEMNHFTMTGRQCIICKKRFVPAPPQPATDAYVEEV